MTKMNKDDLPALIVNILETNGGVMGRKTIGRIIFNTVLRLCGAKDDFLMTMYYDLGWAQKKLADLDIVKTRRVGADWEWYLA